MLLFLLMNLKYTSQVLNKIIPKYIST